MVSRYFIGGVVVYRKEIISYIICIFLVFLACLLHALDYFINLNFPVHAIIFALYSFVIVLWMNNMKNRVLRSAIVARFKLIGFLLISYLLVRTLKYLILIENEDAVRFIRYLYLVFPLVLTQLIFLTSLHVGKSERENINKYWSLLWIPTLIASLLIITNNLHGLLFSLDPNAKSLQMYGPVFYFVVFYIGLLTIINIAFTMIYSYKNRYLSSVKLPISIIIIWGIYTFLYMTGWDKFEYFKIFFKSAEFNILMVMLFIESLVFKRLLPSNRGYELFLSLSSLNIGIMDSNGQMIYRPKIYENIDSSLVCRALYNPILIDENTLLESAKINGGISFYFVDLTDFNQLKRKLMNMSEDMLNENELLKAKNSLKKNMIKVEEQNQIREHIHTKLQPQFDILNDIFMNLPEDEDLFETKLKHACFLDVYIKRYSNLFLLTKNKSTLNLSELKLAFCESLDYLSLTGVKTKIDWEEYTSYDKDFCISLYEIFQNALEFYMPGISSISISFFMKNKKPQLIIKITGAKEKSFLYDLDDNYQQNGILISEDITKDEIKLVISLERSKL
ncbi:hypothetical protein FOC70_00010 [Finegoldia magna]|uniref:Histidine kinase N-terminal 7TM region domain-containing protein n=2 Tax=Finegoldia magna TaxID=1260 RepID=A0A7D4JHY0_FINMA|nr:hypothetical protein FOC70_00010 [Finegoldia magna]